LLESTPMKRFYLATPTKYEDQVIEDLGALGTAQLITDYTVGGFKKVDTVEKCEKYLKLQQRMTSVLSALPPEKRAKKSFIQSLRGGSSSQKARAVIPPRRPNLDEIESSVLETEKALDDVLARLENRRSELKNLKATEEKLLILRKHGLRTDALGDFEAIFVKAGFINRALSGKLQKYVEGTSVRFSKWPDRREEDFFVILGMNRDKPLMQETLVRLNFAELTLPSGVATDPTQALDKNRGSITKAQEEINVLEKGVRGICEDFQKKATGFEPVVRRALSVETARSTFSRSGTLTLVHGWVPAKQEESLKSTIAASTDGAVFLKVDKPAPDEHAPSQISNKGIAGSFELFTRLRGTPQYSELDPTVIITVLFPIMYGMMFGDIGEGAVLFAMGLIFRHLRRSFLGIPGRAMAKLGAILATCGISAVFFGALYGEFFLYEAFEPIFVNPIQGLTTIIVVALLFGVVQLSLGLVLRIVNLIRMRERIEAVFGGVRLVYYGAGVVLAIKFATNMSFAIFTQNLGLTIVGIVSLAVLFFSPVIHGFIKHELRFGQDIMKGASEFIETFLSYLTNSISYVRLAAFAIAHAALGLSAVILAETVGFLPSYIIMNFLVMTIEALGVFIQCMRLTYYEFFTKFYSGGGVPYRPFSLPKFSKPLIN
jgi:vacuolar-type H+-ATPase subunit I/STV1